MRILLTAPPLADVLSPGGIYKVVREIAKNLSKRGHEVIVLQLNPLNRPNEEFYEGFKIIRVNSRHFYGLSFGMYSYLKKHFNKLNPDIVHVHGYHNLLSLEIIYSIKKYNPNIPIVFSPHYMPSGHATIWGYLLWPLYNKISDLFIFPKIDYIIVASNFEKESLISDVPYVKNIKIAVIPHGVDIIDIKQKIKKDNKEITLLFVGYLQKRKGVQYIIRAIYELINKYNAMNIKLKIIGEGPYKQNLMKLAKQLNVNQYIFWRSFIPNRKELFEEIQNADILLLLSKNENYGLTIAEALALGTPVIVTKHSALREFLNEPGCFGVDYPPNPQEVAELILKIANSDVKVGPFSKKIRTWEEVVRDYEKVYIKLVGGHL